MSNLKNDEDSLAARIRIARTSARMTQQEFAEALGVHKNTAGKWERGETEPDLRSVSQLCGKLGISAYWLLNGSGPMLEKDRDIKAVVEDGTTAGDLRGYKLSEVSGGPEFDATFARLQARMAQLEKERDEARAAELRAKDEALKAKDEALQAMKATLAMKDAPQGEKPKRPSIDDEPPTDMPQYDLPSTSRKSGTKK